MKPSYSDLEKRVIELEYKLSNMKQKNQSSSSMDEKVKGLFDRTLDAVYILDFQGNFLDANGSTLWMLGYTKEELTALNFFKLIPTEQMHFAMNILQDTKMITEYTKAIEFKVKRKDGKSIWIATRATIVYDGENPVEIHGIAVDISERIRIEAELQKREEDLKLALNGADLGVWHWNIKKDTVSIEKDWGDRVGLPADRIINFSEWGDWIHPDDRKDVNKRLYDHLEGKTSSFNAEHRLKASEDKWIWVVSRGKIVENDNDDIPVRLAGTYHDITERKKMEKTLISRQKELKEQSLHLEESNTALRVLLKQRERDKDELAENVMSNVKELVIPYMDKIGSHSLSETQVAYLRTAKSNLNEIVSPFVRNLSATYLSLTPMEIQVASLVKHGKSTKEIAEILSLSKGTIDFHRDNIRKKTGIKNKKINLRTHLLSLS